MHRVLLSLLFAFPFAFPLAFLLVVAPAFAVDGVLEINQACAVETGCFSGDSAGWPVTIVSPGSYRLTGNLQLSDPNVTAVEVQASNVTLNLGGFEIRGVTRCAGTPLVCSPTGTGNGVVFVDPELQQGVRVHDGNVIGMGSAGVGVGFRGVVERVRASQNGYIGLFGSDSSALRDCTADLNGADGLSTGSGATVTGNAVYGNATSGINAGDGSTVAGNTAYRNGIIGVSGGNGSNLTGNVAFENSIGIFCVSGCRVSGNTVRGNLNNGISLGAGAAYRDNVVTENGTGTIAGPGSANNLGEDYCVGTGTVSASCP